MPRAVKGSTMGKVVAQANMSLDGFVGSDREHPGVAVSDAELKPLFEQLPESRHLDLVEATPFPSGIVVHVYRPQHT